MLSHSRASAVLLETLEGRRLLSGNAAHAGLSHGTLAIHGTRGEDVIILSADDTHVVATVNGELHEFARNKVKRIIVEGGKGNDDIEVSDPAGTFDIRVAFFGGKDSDTLSGGAGNDLLVGGDGMDFMFGSGGNDCMLGGAGDDIMSGGEGNDHLHGGKGNDLMGGGDGDDVLFGGAGIDEIHGEAGADRYGRHDDPSERVMDEFDSILPKHKHRHHHK